MFRKVAAALVLVAGISVTPVAAAEAEANGIAAMALSAAEMASNTDWTLAPVKIGAEHHASTRSPLLPALYASLAALNAYDAYSTSAAVKRAGAIESNPL